MSKKRKEIPESIGFIWICIKSYSALVWIETETLAEEKMRLIYKNDCYILYVKCETRI